MDVKQNELPSQEMYMSGKSLYPLSISLAAKLTAEFDGKLRISYSGGADFHNIEKIVDAGIWPVTVATTLLKPGGYDRMAQIAKLLEKENEVFTAVSVEKTAELAGEVKTNPHHVKAIKPLPSRKMRKQVPLLDCFVAPCREGCPIHQDIPLICSLSKPENTRKRLKLLQRKIRFRL